MGGMFLIPLYVESITEKTELITTTKSIPKSLKPINNIANGIHAILGNDIRPTANELIVFPNCRNFIISNPMHNPSVIDRINPRNNLHNVTNILFTNVKSNSNSRIVSPTERGEGREIFGKISKM
jgi:hypothetical protein